MLFPLFLLALLSWESVATPSHVVGLASPSNMFGNLTAALLDVVNISLYNKDLDIEIIHMETKCNSQVALAASMDSLKSERKVEAVIGGMCSSATRSLSFVLQTYGIPNIAYGATSNEFSDSGTHPLILRTVPSISTKIFFEAALMAHFGFTRLAVIVAADAFVGIKKN